jgi:hypothetical protein
MQIVDTRLLVWSSGKPPTHQRKLPEAQLSAAQAARYVIPRTATRHSGLRPIVEHLEHRRGGKHDAVVRRNAELLWQRKAA